MQKHIYAMICIMVMLLLLTGCSLEYRSTLEMNQLLINSTATDTTLSPAADTSVEATPTMTPTISPSPPTTLPIQQTSEHEVDISATTCYIKGDGVRMRSSPSTEADVVTTFDKGEMVTRIAITHDWSQVTTMNQTGYIRSDLLSEEKILPKPTNDNTAPASHPPEKLTSPHIIVRKSERKLELWDRETLYGSYSIGLGWEPIGHKQVEGDGRTPEGTYYVCVRNSQSSYYLSLGVSYPNKVDAKAALDAGTIDKSTYNQIADAIDNKARPPWNTAMGGQIMIHGMGGDRDWTAGCVALDNDVMDLLWKYCPNKTPITIQP